MNKWFKTIATFNFHRSCLPNMGDGRYEADYPSISQTDRSPSGLLAQLAVSL